MTRLAPAAPPALLTVAVVVFALLEDSTYRYNLATLAGIYAIAAIGLTLLFGGAGQISLGHAGFVGIGAWGTAALTVDRGWPYPLAIVAAVSVAVLVGIVLGYAALRIAGHYLALATVAFGLLFVEVMETFLPSGIYAVPPVSVAGLEAGSARALFLVVWLTVVLAYVATQSLVRSRFGRALAALRDDELAAASCGVDISRAKIVVFAISAAFAGVAGALFAPYQTSVTDVSFGFFLSVNLLIMAVIGGLGSPFGAILGALFLVVIPEFGRDFERLRLLGFGVLLVLAVVLFPGGLAAIGRRLRLLRQRRWTGASP